MAGKSYRSLSRSPSWSSPPPSPQLSDVTDSDRSPSPILRRNMGRCAPPASERKTSSLLGILLSVSLGVLGPDNPWTGMLWCFRNFAATAPVNDLSCCMLKSFPPQILLLQGGVVSFANLSCLIWKFLQNNHRTKCAAGWCLSRTTSAEAPGWRSRSCSPDPVSSADGRASMDLPAGEPSGRTWQQISERSPESGAWQHTPEHSPARGQ